MVPWIEVSPLLEWAIAIIGWAVDWIGVFCVLAFTGVVLVGFMDQLALVVNRAMRALRKRRKGRYRG